MSNQLNNLFLELEEMKASEKKEDQVDIDEIIRKGKSAPIKDHALKESDEYIQNLYLTMLSSVAQYENSNIEEKFIFIQRIISGAESNIQIRDLLKLGVSVDDKFVDEFLKEFQNSELKYSFVIDSLILAHIAGIVEEKTVLYIAELIDLLGLTKKEIEFLAQIIVVILEHDNGKLRSSVCPNTIDINTIVNYISDIIYESKIIDNSHMLYYLGKNSKTLKFENETRYSQEKVVIENMCIDLNNNNIYFKENKEVIFKNCAFVGNKGRIFMDGINSVCIENCKFRNFSEVIYKREIKGGLAAAMARMNAGMSQPSHDKSLEIKNIGDIRFENCKFENIKGGCIGLENIDKLVIEDCTFNKCEGVRPEMFSSIINQRILGFYSIKNKNIKLCIMGNLDGGNEKIDITNKNEDEWTIIKNDKEKVEYINNYIS